MTEKEALIYSINGINTKEGHNLVPVTVMVFPVVIRDASVQSYIDGTDQSLVFGG